MKKQEEINNLKTLEANFVRKKDQLDWLHLPADWLKFILLIFTILFLPWRLHFYISVLSFIIVSCKVSSPSCCRTCVLTNSYCNCFVPVHFFIQCIWIDPTQNLFGLVKSKKKINNFSASSQWKIWYRNIFFLFGIQFFMVSLEKYICKDTFF